MSDDFKVLLAKAATGATLTRDESALAFNRMMSGEATPSQMGALLMALRVRGETVDEITGAVTTMRAKMLKVTAPPDAIDVVGTGGDASGSYNISTCTAFIVAGAGVPVAKHGNRALSSRAGAADVLAALGVKIYTIGIGIEQPCHLPKFEPRTGKLQLDAAGNVIPTLLLQPANYSVLEKIAALSRANFYRATNRRELQAIYNHIDRLEKTEVKLKRYATYRPLFQWPLLAALGLLAVELTLAYTRYRRVP